MLTSIRNQIALLLLLGYGWIFYAFTQELTSHASNGYSVCIIKNVSGYPCVGCGSTRAILLFLHGNFEESILLNPIGIGLLFLMIIASILLFLEIVLRKKYLTNTYLYINNKLLKKPFILSILGLLIVSNWIWNIVKMN